MLSPQKRETLPSEYSIYENNHRPIVWDELVYESDEWRNNILKKSYEEKMTINNRLKKFLDDYEGAEQNGHILSIQSGSNVLYIRVCSKNNKLESLLLLC